MSYSYECNVICDECRDKCVSGEPMDNQSQAKESAIRFAENEGWYYESLQWFCPDCHQKVKVDK